MSGLRLAVLYGFSPHKLGFCGPEEKFLTRQVYDFLCGKKISQRKIRKILEGFKGAFFYYRLIAKSNNIRDSFDEKVVKAYWIGNELLEKVKISDLRQMIIKDFSAPGLLSKKIALRKAQGIPKNSIPHHSFHVLIISSVTGRIVLKGKLLNLCRIGWGKVIKISNTKYQISKIVVEYQPLTKRFRLGKQIKKEIFWDKVLAPEIRVGDWVSFHWNHLVQKLEREDLENLKKYTKITLKRLAKMG